MATKGKKGKKSENQGTLKSIGALWRTKSEKVALAGNLKMEGRDGPEISILVFKNDKGDNPKRPDFRIVMVVEGEEGDTGSQTSDESDIPF